MPVVPRVVLSFRVRAVLFLALALTLFTAFVAAPAAADELVMFEQQGCPYCAAWDRQVGSIYPKTDEAKTLTLRRVDIHDDRPQDLRAVRGVVFTPTFVVMHCGRELRRIIGYAGDEQFWGLLDEAVKTIQAAPACPKGATHA